MEEIMTPGTATVFDTVPATRSLPFYEHDALAPKKVADFLKMTKDDMAEAAGVPKGSIRYDERIPADVHRYFLELASACEVVAEVFKGDAIKTEMWFHTRNPLLGNVSPRDMIRLGRFGKLMRFIQNARLGERP
jgi:hypothetical protein